MFQERVFEIVKAIPLGQTLTYKDVAKLAGSPGAHRAVGTILKRNMNTSIPCHRVIRSDGAYGDYNGLRGKTKQEILEEERRLSSKKYI